MPEVFSEKQLEKNGSSEPTLNHPVSIFSTFIYHPRGINFSRQEEDEEILLFLRRDFITNLPWILTFFVLLLIPPLLPLVLQFENISLATFPQRFIFLLLIFYYLIALGFAFANFTSWFYNIGLITKKRVIDVDFNNLSSKNVAATVLQEVEDVHYAQKGFFATLFDYGTVTATTVAGKENFTFDRIPSPAKVVDILSKIIGEQKR